MARGDHINAEGQFQSDKYPDTPAGVVPLKLTDRDARTVLRTYLELHRERDPDFSADLLYCITVAESADLDGTYTEQHGRAPHDYINCDHPECQRETHFQREQQELCGGKDLIDG